jgi:hypothetical protein
MSGMKKQLSTVVTSMPLTGVTQREYTPEIASHAPKRTRKVKAKSFRRRAIVV